MSARPSPRPIAPQGQAAAKAELRRSFRALRLQVLPPDGEGQGEQAAILAAAERELPALTGPGHRLGLYWPLRGEVDLRPLAGLGVALALPAVVPAAPGMPARMIYRPWSPGEPLAADACGIPAPMPARGALAADALGLLLVPALAFDPASGIRLGQGGGWYDRLRADAAWAAVPALAVLPAACLQRSLPRDSWDVPFAGWLDGAGVHRLERM
ncbi:MAG: 5-formyltetrahydrofolate cyclo-ligase [Cyanobium sp.]